VTVAHRAALLAIGSLTVLVADAGSGTALIGIVAAVAGALGAYLAVARKLSGRVSTTDANKLWDEAGSIRQDYRQQLADLREELAEARADLADARIDLAQARRQIRELEDLVTYLRNGGKDR
jgi:uncharacterized protein HemX